MKIVWKQVAAAAVILVMLGAAPGSAQSAAQPPRTGGAATSPWSADVGFGIDNSISGNINSSGIGRIDNQVAVVLKNSYEDVYGTGLHVRFGGGYMLDEVNEVRVT